jgi:flagellar basal body rod protein FlgG
MKADGSYALGNPQQLEEGVRGVSSGYVEQSNVSAVDALAAMIETSRLYEMNTRLVSTFNSIDQKGSELLSGWQ